MHAGLLNVLHDGANDDLFAVTHGINIDLNRRTKETVQQHGRILGHPDGIVHVAQQILLAIHDLHRATAEDVRWTDHQWITNLCRRRDSRLDTPHRRICRLAERQGLNHLLKTLPVLRAINLIRRGTDDGHTRRLKSASQFERRLTTKLNNHPGGLLEFNNLEHIFQGDRLKIQSV